MKKIIRVAAAVAFDDNNRLLLATRHPGANQAGRWEFPGGKIEPNEAIAECIARELREELNLQLDNAELFLAQSYEYPDAIVQLFFFWGRVSHGQTPLPQEAQQCGWFSADHLPEDMVLADLELMQALSQKKWQNPWNATDVKLPIAIDEELTLRFAEWINKK